ncbi:MAG: hypothetical protein JW952_04785, partial [Candidatus Eisenbacteria bacterium]|nr:hypothetical protein [Candidatus Eisenbacteria bacterium]
AMAVTAAVAVAVFVVMGGPGPAAKGLASALGQSLRGAADLLVSAGRAAAANHGAGVVTTAGLVVCAALALDRLLLEPLLCKTEPRGRF